MKTLIAILTATLVLISSQTLIAGDKSESINSATAPKAANSVRVMSLREGNNLFSMALSFPKRAIMVVEDGIDVNYDDQPPLIPHELKDETISLTQNDCLSCHSKAGAKKHKDAGKAPNSHFRDRNGNKTSKIAARRYFCTQCHYTQQDKAPIVKNNYFNPDE